MSDALNAMVISKTLSYLCQLMLHSNKSIKTDTLINLITLVGIRAAGGIIVDITIIPITIIDPDLIQIRIKSNVSFVVLLDKLPSTS